MPLVDIQGAVPGLPVTHAVIHAPGKVKSQRFREKKNPRSRFLFIFKALKISPWDEKPCLARAYGPWEESFSCVVIFVMNDIFGYYDIFG